MTTPMPARELYRYTLEETEHGRLDVLAFFSPQDLEGLGGLPGRAILARMKDAEGTLEESNLEWNGAFLQLLHDVVRDTFPLLPELAQIEFSPEATHMYVRVTRPGRTSVSEAPEDVVGRFAVADGALVPDSYEAHPGFLPVTPEGLFIMHPDLERALLTHFTPAPPAN